MRMRILFLSGVVKDMVVEICSVTAFTELGDFRFFDGEECKTTAT